MHCDILLSIIRSLDTAHPYDLASVVEARVVLRTAELRQQLHTLIDKIAVRDFHEVNGHVSWTVHIPPTLLTLVNQLPAALEPHEK